MAYKLNGSTGDSLMNMERVELYPIPIEDDFSVSKYTELPYSQLSALGPAIDPLVSAITKIASGTDSASGLYRVTVPSGMHLAQLKNGAGNIGTYLNTNNVIKGQAVLTPISCDPTMIFVAVAIAAVESKLASIQELQRDLMSFLQQKERSEIRANLLFLQEILENYKYNWNNEMYKCNNHIKVLDIRQTAEQKIMFYRDQISSVFEKRALFHSSKSAQKQIDKIQLLFREYQLAVYTLAFSSFLDVMLVGNFSTQYLSGIKEKIEAYSYKYRELYTNCYNHLEEYCSSSIQSSIVRGLTNVSRVAGSAISKVPLINKGPVDEALIEAGCMMEQYSERKTTQRFRQLVSRHNSYVRPFIENIERIEQYYNNPLTMIVGQDVIYIGVTE